MNVNSTSSRFSYPSGLQIPDYPSFAVIPRSREFLPRELVRGHPGIEFHNKRPDCGKAAHPAMPLCHKTVSHPDDCLCAGSTGARAAGINLSSGRTRWNPVLHWSGPLRTSERGGGSSTVFADISTDGVCHHSVAFRRHVADVGEHRFINFCKKCIQCDDVGIQLSISQDVFVNQ